MAKGKPSRTDYCLTTISPDSRNPKISYCLGMRPWRSWIARQTPTLKAAGSNPVGRTKIPCKLNIYTGFYSQKVQKKK